MRTRSPRPTPSRLARVALYRCYVLATNSYRILAQDRLPRTRLLVDYLRIFAGVHVLRRPPAGCEQLLGWDICFAQRSVFLYLVEDLFIRQAYHFRATCSAPVIVDAGANIGMATLFFKAVYPDAQVEAVECNPDAVRLLRENLQRNCIQGVRVHEKALWSAPASLTLHLDRVDATSTVATVIEARARGQRRLGVVGQPLSELLPHHTDLLKLDIEGAEPLVLDELVSSGAIRSVSQLVFEYNHDRTASSGRLWAVLRTLADAGFEYRLHVDHSSRSAYPWDGEQNLLVYAQRTPDARQQENRPTHDLYGASRDST